MSNKEKILQLAKENGGVISSKSVTQHGIARSSLTALVAEKRLLPVERGLYVTPSGYIDDYVLIQYKFPKGIFSHETALYLLGFSDRIPTKIQMTFPKGYNTKKAKNYGLQAIISNKVHLSSPQTILRSGETYVRVFDIERTLVDLLSKKYDADKEQVFPALKQYFRSSEKNITKLMTYSRIFHVEKTMQKYLEVLL
jgi:predicted transcriptional regulator of viral defense system